MLTLALFALLATATAYIWPSPQFEALDEMRFEQPLAGFVNPCDLFIFDGSRKSGRADSADWIRTAYHDMATHNVKDGTGGLGRLDPFLGRDGATRGDAGDGFQNTINVLAGQSNRYVSIADVVALGAVIAVENCGGPEIAFRGGRVDATEPNAPGVPQPQESLDSHIASFARQGFTQTEMIGLVACGHTFGGVQHAPFPDIVPELNDPNSTESVAHFDSSFVNFDNNIATEYISGTTQNPLVVGLNDTTNSDKRIFGSDGNVTMSSFANSPELFASTCAELFAKMIDTVPRGVQLTDVVTPLPVKPIIAGFDLDGDTLRLGGRVRLWNMTQDTAGTVRLLWDDHVGGTNNITLPFGGGFTNSGGRNTGVYYTFSTTPSDSLSIDAAAGITQMRFTVNDKLEDQGGLGFLLPDGVVISTSSCIDFDFNGSITGHLDLAVRNTITPTRVFIEAETSDDSGRPIVVEIEVPRPSEAATANATYSIWSVQLNSDQQFNFYTVGAELDGGGKLLGPHQFFDFAPC
ncbi:Peroxidase [Mycena venus]|uniref:Peroxidase n=1 Tax=Mycena venus TaxID=2733690 RepID=A0A8H7CXI9_9AGAR|nr:Peroxidase [Mycena venus]